MTELRDARLQRALDHAPDSHMTPDARTRAAIRAMAGKEVAGPDVAAVAAPWWKRLAGGTGSGRMPWNAVLGSVLLAGLVTVIWRNEEVPGARTGDLSIADAPVKARGASSSVPSAVPAAASSPAAQTSPAATEVAGPPAPAKAGSPSASPVAAAKPQSSVELLKKEETAQQSVRDEPAATERKEADATERKEAGATERKEAGASGKSLAEARSARREDERQRREERSRDSGAVASSPAITTAPPVAAPAAAAPAPAPAPAPGAPASPPPVATSQSSPARAMAPAPLAAPAAKATQPLADRVSGNESAAAGGAIAGRVASDAGPAGAMLGNWTQARITLDGKTVTLARSGSGNLAALLRDFAARATRAAGVSGAVLLRAELLRDGELIGVLEVGESSVRRVVRLQQQEVVASGTVTAEEVQELLREVRGLMGR
jgi:hypothetical protein